MAKVQPVKHGRDHTPDGADPIPGVVVTPAFPTSYPQALFAQFRNGMNWTSIDLRSDVPHNATLNNYQHDFGSGSSRTATDGDHIYGFARLGPRDSVWAMTAGFVRGPDFGKVEFALATVPEHAYDVFLGASSPDNDLDDITSLTFDAILPSMFDGYTSVESVDLVNGAGAIRLRGEDGMQHSAFTDPGEPADTTALQWTDGGAGIWAYRLKVNGKNASSTGYKAAIWELTWHRTDGIVDS